MVRNTNSNNEPAHQNHLKSNFNAADPYTGKAQVELKGRTISRRRRDHLRVLSAQHLPPRQLLLLERDSQDLCKAAVTQKPQAAKKKKKPPHHLRSILSAKGLLTGDLGLRDGARSQRFLLPEHSVRCPRICSASTRQAARCSNKRLPSRTRTSAALGEALVPFSAFLCLSLQTSRLTSAPLEGAISGSSLTSPLLLVPHAKSTTEKPFCR